MKLARVILFTSQMDAMSRFYGKVLGLRQVSSEKGWQEARASRCIPALHRRAAKGQSLYSTPKTLLLCVKSWWRGEQVSVKSAKERYFACVTAKIQTAIPIQLSNR